ncbi:hypothetical protein ABPG72_009667 [Tetrahymena utriculariae]
MDWINRLENIQNKIKFQLHAKKIDDLESLYRLIAEFDIDNSGKLEKDEFLKLLSKLGVFLTTQELRAVYDTYDTNRDEQISYAEFVQMIRTTISDKRLAVVKHAFQFLDRRGSGKLAIQDLVQQYRSEAHPRVRTRHKTAEQVKAQFVNAISKKSQDGQTINENEFLEYYADVNATLPKEKEEYFIDIILSTWGITSSVDYVSPERLSDLELILYEKIRQKTLPGEDEGRTVYRAFKYFDIAEKGVIDISQFKAALEKFGCVFDDKEIHALFSKFDVNRSGKICYDEFCGNFARLGSGNNPNFNPVFKLAREVPSPIINKLNADLKKQGPFAFRSLSKACQKADTFLNGSLSHDEFKWVIKEIGFSLTKTEFDNLFKFFDKNYEGKVIYSVFIDLVRGQQSEIITQGLSQGYDTLASANGGKVNVESIVQRYNPLAIQIIYPTRKIAQDLQREFVAEWGGNLQQQVNKNDFVEFFSDVRAFCDSESKFHQYFSNAFGL